MRGRKSTSGESFRACADPWLALAAAACLCARGDDPSAADASPESSTDARAIDAAPVDGGAGDAGSTADAGASCTDLGTGSAPLVLTVDVATGERVIVSRSATHGEAGSPVSEAPSVNGSMGGTTAVIRCSLGDSAMAATWQ